MRQKVWMIVLCSGFTVFVIASILQIGQAGSSSAAPQLTPTLGPTQTPYYDISVEVTSSAWEIPLGEQISVTVNLVNHSTECIFAGYDMTLSEMGIGDPLFQFDSPQTVGPPLSASAVFTLTAVTSGTVQLRAMAYGERYCNDFWVWQYESGVSLPMIVGGTFEKQYFPFVAVEEATN